MARLPSRALVFKVASIVIVLGVAWYFSLFLGSHFPGLPSLLIQFSVVAAVLAIGSGLLFPSLQLWKWADLIYYLLAVIGIVLLFIGNERERSASDLRVKLDELNGQIGAIRLPPNRTEFIGIDWVKTEYNGIKVELELGQACRKVFSTEGNCIEAESHEEKISKIFGDFSLPDQQTSAFNQAVIFQDFCDRARKLLSVLVDSDGSFKKVADSVAGIKPEQMVLVTSQRQREEFVLALGRDRDNLLSQLRTDQREFATKIWENKIYLMQQLNWSLTACLAIPGDQAEYIKQTAAAQTRKADLSSRKESLEQQMQALGKGGRGVILGSYFDFLFQSFWSFLLVSALSWKIAKATASLRQ